MLFVVKSSFQPFINQHVIYIMKLYEIWEELFYFKLEYSQYNYKYAVFHVIFTIVLIAG